MRGMSRYLSATLKAVLRFSKGLSYYNTQPVLWQVIKQDKAIYKTIYHSMLSTLTTSYNGFPVAFSTLVIKRLRIVTHKSPSNLYMFKHKNQHN